MSCGANDQRMFSSRRISPEIQAVRVDVLDAAQLAGLDQLLGA